MKISAAKVYFTKDMEGKPSREYSYKIPPSMKVRVNDLVVIPSSRGGFQLGTVSGINDDMDWKPGINWKWLVQVVDTSDYDFRMKLEKGLKA